MSSWQSGERAGFFLPVPFCSTQALGGLDGAPHPTQGRPIYFTASTDPNADLIWQHPGPHIQTSCLAK